MSTLVTNLVQLGLAGGSGNISYDATNTEIDFSAAGNFSGNVIATYFVGDGSQLANVAAGTSITSFDYYAANSNLVIAASGNNFTASLSANSANGASTIVARDGAGSFTANVITATSFVGDGSQLTGLSAGDAEARTLAILALSQ